MVERRIADRPVIDVKAAHKRIMERFPKLMARLAER